MFFNKISLKKPDVFAGVTDCHSHILPNVDDGVKSIEDALEILTYFESLGIKRVVLTPHVMEDYPLNNIAALKERFNLLCDAYRGKIELLLGAEYMLDSAFERLLDSNELLPVFEDYLLTETSYMCAPLNFFYIIDRVHSKGNHMILAHPERYLYMDDDYYKRLKDRNVLFQMNILSLCGTYGRKAKEKSKTLLQKGYYDYIGSDIHSLKTFRREFEQAKFTKSIISSLNILKMKQVNSL